MAGKQSSFILQEDIAKLASLLGGKDCILLGDSTLPFYSVNRGTKIYPLTLGKIAEEYI